MTFLGGDIITTINELGIKIFHLAILFVLLIILAALVFKFIHWSKLRSAEVSIKKTKIIIFLLISNFYLFYEQTTNIDRSYFLRSFYLSFYPELKSLPLLVVQKRKPLTEPEISSILKEAGYVEKPKNIILIILEGVPKYIISKQNAPHLNQIKNESDHYPNAQTEAIATNLALNNLLFSSTALNFEQDISNSADISYAAIPFEILKKSNYEIYLGISTDFNMKQDSNRALGKRHTVDIYKNSYSLLGEKRNINDNFTKKSFLEWLHGRNNSKHFLATLQFDSTHWPYEFDEKNAYLRPYLDKDTLDKFDTPDKTILVTNKYKNAIKQIDNTIGEIVSDLKTLKQYDDTILVIISDHGESFKKGFVTHLNLSKESKDILFLSHIPGKKTEIINDFLSHRDVWPLIFKNIGLSANIFNKVDSPLSTTAKRNFHFTVSPNLKLGELEDFEKIIHFKINNKESQVELTPYLITNKKREIINYDLNTIELIKLKKDLEINQTF
jgi:membrane-anchored protein YejM (alkaline phosphatase superfamily)